jgi:hypothetical protein
MPAIKIHTKKLHPFSYYEKGPESIGRFSEIGKLAQILNTDEIAEISFKQISAVRNVASSFAEHISNDAFTNEELISKWMTFLRSLVFRLYRYSVKMILNCNENKKNRKIKMSKSRFRTMQAVLEDILRKIEQLPE